MLKIGLTGHRTKRLKGHEQEVKEWIYHMIDVLSEGQHGIELLCGCAEGADEIFGLYAEGYDYNEVELNLIMPFLFYRVGEVGMDKLMIRANRTTVLYEKWNKYVDSLRDQYIANHCDVLLAVWDGKKSKGVQETIEYAKAAGKVIIYCPQSILKWVRNSFD